MHFCKVLFTPLQHNLLGKFVNLFNTDNDVICLFVCLFGVLRRFQHCTGHITTGSWKGRGNQYI